MLDAIEKVANPIANKKKSDAVFTPAANGATNIRKFFVHCFGRRTISKLVAVDICKEYLDSR
jgi:hypothetical protein